MWYNSYFVLLPLTVFFCFWSFWISGNNSYLKPLLPLPLSLHKTLFLEDPTFVIIQHWTGQYFVSSFYWILTLRDFSTFYYSFWINLFPLPFVSAHHCVQPVKTLINYNNLYLKSSKIFRSEFRTHHHDNTMFVFDCCLEWMKYCKYIQAAMFYTQANKTVITMKLSDW